jgi:hypothetical protein
LFFGGRVVPSPSFWAFCPRFRGLFWWTGWGGVLLSHSNCPLSGLGPFERSALGGSSIHRRDLDSDSFLTGALSLDRTRASLDPVLSPHDLVTRGWDFLNALLSVEAFVLLRDWFAVSLLTGDTSLDKTRACADSFLTGALSLDRKRASSDPALLFTD